MNPEQEAEFNEHPLGYFWLMMKTRLGLNCTYLETHFDNVSFAHGTYRGTASVVGVPGRITRDRTALLKRLTKHKGRGQSLTLRISDNGYEYRTESGLRAVISRGKKGTLFENDRRLGKIEGPSTLWIWSSFPYVERDPEADRIRVVNY